MEEKNRSTTGMYCQMFSNQTYTVFFFFFLLHPQPRQIRLDCPLPIISVIVTMNQAQEEGAQLRV